MGLNFIKTQNINTGLTKDVNEFVSVSERIYFDQLHIAAEKIRLECNDKPVVLLSGPSGSGKTTSALRIAKQLERKGKKVHTISMDNYFLPNGVGEMPLDENGKVDLESPLRMDIKLFASHLRKLINNESVEMPVFNFETQNVSEYVTVKREPNEIIIFEGIHALNPLVTGDCQDNTTCIYVSVRTRIKSNDGDILHPSNIRLMRRLNRDRLFRGRQLEDVFNMYKSVSRGEELYIMPHKHRADIDIDTFLAYEASVYSDMLRTELENVKAVMKDNSDYQILLKILSELNPLNNSYTPTDSLVREFIGGSEFKY